MSEFTGERVIPREVNDDLWAEHFARYAFAKILASDKRTLDVGCGAGYGVAELAQTARRAFGIDIACEPVAYARAHYGDSNAIFLQASATALPFANQSFDLLTAFEVIEHLADWRALVAEAKRVLRSDGVLLISTPNKDYYTESRAQHGPNPFHVHEFDFSEFQAALNACFPHVSIFLQNWSPSIAISPAGQGNSVFNTRVDSPCGDPAEAHFFLAICSCHPQPPPPFFLYLPTASNVLREREHHVRMLEGDLAAMTADRDALIELHDQQTGDLEARNRWALQLDRDLNATLTRVAEVQEELRIEQARSAEVAAAYARKVAELEDENRARTEWALETERRLSADLASRLNELAEVVRLLDAAEATVVERTLWAQQAQATVGTLREQLRMIRESRWVRLGRVVGIGPRVEG